MRRKTLILLMILAGTAGSLSAQDSIRVDSTDHKEVIEKLKYKQQPGLALAASKIFFSEKRYSVSGFGEFNFVHYRGDKDTDVGDIEMYYTNLYRFATFFGYRFSDKVIWNSELQIEYMHDGTREGHAEIVIEAFMDFLLTDYFKARVGFYPLTIGYVNNNDEPVMFYSVNRSEVERIIMPSTWIELGVMFYGNITKDLSYALGVSQGLNAQNYLGGTWIRQGREIRVDVPRSVSLNPYLSYTGVKNLTLSASGYVGNSGQGSTVTGTGGEVEEVRAPILLGTAYAKYDWKNFRVVTVGTYGQLGQTDRIWQLTSDGAGSGQVLGNETFGYLFELGCDILPYIRGNKPVKQKENALMNTHEMKLPVFIRYERLNTHHRVHHALAGLPRTQNDLDILTVGVNFNTRENIVIKANYQFRHNRYEDAAIPESDVLELGIGFIF